MAAGREISINIQVENNSESTSQLWQCGSPDLLNYDQMIQRVVELFPATREQSLELLWKDSDGDLVTVSSDEELHEAFSSVTNTSYVQFVVRASVPRPQPVTCHACRRFSLERHLHYICVRCPDYVLCHQCRSSANLHSHHPMVRLKPANNTQHLQTPSPQVGSQSALSSHPETKTQKDNSDSHTQTLPDPGVSSTHLIGSAATITKQRTRKRQMRGMVEQCRKGVQQLDIKRTTKTKVHTNDAFQNPVASGLDADDDDEELDRCEAKMEEWLKQNWDLDNSANAEPPWKQMMRQLDMYWHGDRK